MEEKFNYDWNLKDANFTKDKGKVFSCFACGGGSTMGYKLAGFDVIGMNEIDPRMADCYVKNHNPKYTFIEPIQEFKLRDDLPKELFNLDILDGSPPCSSFSMAGNREKDWGKNKHFKEGQSEQVLDTLFFDFIDLAKKLQPKVVVAENVKGLLLGNAKKYLNEIGKQFDEAGYYVDKWLLNSRKMGVPQKRERVFLVAIRKDLVSFFKEGKDLFNPMPILNLDFKMKDIPFGKIYEENVIFGENKVSESYKKAWEKRQNGDLDLSCTMGREFNRPNSFFSCNYIYKHKVLNTITGSEKNILFDECRTLTKNEIIKGGAFPSDYNFLDQKPGYIVGMSVPPLMIANISKRIYEQWLSKMKIEKV